MDIISLKVESDLAAELEKAARREGISKSEYARRALRDRMRLQQTDMQRTPTALELAGDLVGSIKGGPGDLSINPRYMEGFGEDSRGPRKRR